MSPLELTLRTLGRAACLSSTEIDKLITEFCPTVTIDKSDFYRSTVHVGSTLVYTAECGDIGIAGLDSVDRVVQEVAKALGVPVVTKS